MPDLSNKFGRKEWKDCCGKGCKKCEIAQSYIAAYGRGDGLAQLRADRKTALAARRKRRRARRRASEKKKGAAPVEAGRAPLLLALRSRRSPPQGRG
jgi:hypothetical protein